MSAIIVRAREPRVRPPFNARPVCVAGRASRSSQGPYATHYTATASYLYIMRQPGEDRIGLVPDAYLMKDDLVATGRCHPIQRVPLALREGDRLWREADEAAARDKPTTPSAMHIVADLPPGGERSGWERLVTRYCYDELVGLGMIVDWAIHAPVHTDGRMTLPHVHLLATTLFWRESGRKGTRQQQWLCTRPQIRAAHDSWMRLVGSPLTTA